MSAELVEAMGWPPTVLFKATEEYMDSMPLEAIPLTLAEWGKPSSWEVAIGIPYLIKRLELGI
jgi:hypothetical protein